jgi:hypothetical protein
MADEQMVTDKNCYPLPLDGKDPLDGCGDKYISDDWCRQNPTVPSCQKGATTPQSGTGVNWKLMRMYKGAGKDVITEYCVENKFECKAQKEKECKEFFAAQEREMKEENNGVTV